MEKKYLLRYASVDGLILSSVTVAFMLFSPLVRDTTFVGIILSVAKIAGCITLLYYLMKRYALANNCKRYGECFGYGLLVCLFSSSFPIILSISIISSIISKFSSYK